ncbi:MAG: fluoride efflux transporter CrcB, partial [Acidobacteriota bacterium]
GSTMMLLWVMLAGGIGSGLRFLVGVWAVSAFGVSFPYGTLIVNLVGCFVLAVVAQLASAGSVSPELRTVIAVGLIGGFTTYSGFNMETIGLLSSGAAGAAGLNIAITIAGGLAAGWLGLTVARMLHA